MEPALLIKYDYSREPKPSRYRSSILRKREAESQRAQDVESFPAPELKLTWTEIQDLLTHQRELETKLEDTKAHLRAGDTIAAAATLEKTSDHTLPVRTFLHAFKDTIPKLKQPPTAASKIKADEVFSTPELLEMILLNLRTPEKLDAMQTCCTWRDTVNGSVKLLRSLGWTAGIDKNYFSPLSPTAMGCQLRDKILGVYFHDEDPSLYAIRRSAAGAEHEIRLALTIDCDSTIAGTRLRSMLICNPPVRTMGAMLYCPDCNLSPERRGSEGRTHSWVRSKSSEGYTLGELTDSAAEICKDHADCEPDHVTFSALVVLDEQDPVVVARRKKREEAARRQEEIDRIIYAESEESEDEEDDEVPSPEEEGEDDDEASGQEDEASEEG